MRLVRPLILGLLVIVGAAFIAHDWLGARPLNAGNFVEPEILRFYADTESLLEQRNFSELEKQIADLRRTNARMVGGDLKLYHLYRALAGYVSTVCNCHNETGPVYDTDANFRKRLDLIRAWQNSGHDETAPLIVKAQLWREYAWKARGRGYSSEVTDAGAALFKARIAEEANAIQAIDRRRDDPIVYTVTLSFARDAGWPRDRIDELYREAVTRYPEHFGLYTQYVNLLQPKWFGEPGELAAYDQSLLDQNPGGDIGLLAYSYVAGFLAAQYGSHELLRETGLTWPEVKRSYQAREVRYGLRVSDWNAYLALSLAASDHAAAAEAIVHIGDNWDNGVWSDWNVFQDVAAWARHPNQARPSDPKPAGL